MLYLQRPEYLVRSLNMHIPTQLLAHTDIFEALVVPEFSDQRFAISSLFLLHKIAPLVEKCLLNAPNRLLNRLLELLVRRRLILTVDGRAARHLLGQFHDLDKRCLRRERLGKTVTHYLLNYNQ